MAADPATLSPDDLVYFQQLLEGRATRSWLAWWDAEAPRLAQQLPRAAWLRLKFGLLDEAARYLQAAGIAVTPSPLARRERLYATLHRDVLDAHGRPKPGARDSAYGGAWGALARGDAALGAQRLRTWVRRTLKQPVAERTEDLTDLCADGEIEWSLGDAAVGGPLLEAVLGLPEDDDLLAPLRERARALLAAGSGVDAP